MPTQGPPQPNRTRDHLANERTFLAWIRTSLGLVGLGFVLARMGLFLGQLALSGMVPRGGHSAGHEFVIIGVVFLLMGTAVGAGSGWLYERTRRAIESDLYEPARGAVFLLVALLVMGGLAITALSIWRMTFQAV